MILPPLDEVDGPITEGMREAWRLIEEDLAGCAPFQPEEAFIYTFGDGAVVVIFDEGGNLEAVAVDEELHHFPIRLGLHD